MFDPINPKNYTYTYGRGMILIIIDITSVHRQRGYRRFSTQTFDPTRIYYVRH